MLSRYALRQVHADLHVRVLTRGPTLNWSAIRHTCCVVCAERWEAHHTDAMGKLWDELPGIWGLEDWAALEQAEREREQAAEGEWEGEWEEVGGTDGASGTLGKVASIQVPS